MLLRIIAVLFNFTTVVPVLSLAATICRRTYDSVAVAIAFVLELCILVLARTKIGAPSCFIYRRIQTWTSKH
jgi:hypothetical protein